MRIYLPNAFLCRSQLWETEGQLGVEVLSHITWLRKNVLNKTYKVELHTWGVSWRPLSLGVLNLEDMTPRLKNSNPINAEEECVRAHACVVIYAIFPPGVKFHSFH